MKGVSVVICCYNSSLRLQKTLEHLASQKFDDCIPWEIVIVDNNSSDMSGEIAKSCWNNFNIDVPLSVVQECEQGLMHARSKGISSATFDYVLFCDDDNWLSPNYIEIAFLILESNLSVAAIGGLGKPHWESTPSSIILKHQGCYAVGPQGASKGKSVPSHHVYGAGCVYRKKALEKLEKVGFVSQLTGRKGQVLECGEDHELCYALVLLGYEIWYDDRLLFFHFIPEKRANLKYLKAMIRGAAKADIVLRAYRVLIEKKPRHKSNYYWVLISLIIFNLTKTPTFIRHKNWLVLYYNVFNVLYMLKGKRIYGSAVKSILYTFKCL